MQQTSVHSLVSAAVLPGRLRIAEAVVSQSLADETVILNLKTGCYHGLNHTAGRVWRLIEQGTPTDDIVSVMASEFDTDSQALLGDMQHLLSDLLSRGLVEADSRA